MKIGAETKNSGPKGRSLVSGSQNSSTSFLRGNTVKMSKILRLGHMPLIVFRTSQIKVMFAHNKEKF